jgi:hypothetical protein
MAGEFRRGATMKKTKLAVLGLIVVGCMSLAAQDVAQPGSALKTSQARQAKAIRISGKVSDDGARFFEETNQKVWRVTNLEALKGYEGQKAVLRGRVGPDTNMIQVLSIRGLSTYTANSGDSAFRR